MSKIIAISVSSLFVFVVGFFLGQLAQKDIQMKKEKELNEQIISLIQGRDEKNNDESVRVITKYITQVREIPQPPKEIIKYVSIEDDIKCVIPVEFIRLHNHAASGTGEMLIPTNGVNASSATVE